MRGETAAKVLTVVAAALAVASIVTRPFLFAPIATIVMLVAAKMSANRRLTAPVATFIAIAALAGAAIAVGFTKPLY